MWFWKKPNKKRTAIKSEISPGIIKNKEENNLKTKEFTKERFWLKVICF